MKNRIKPLLIALLALCASATLLLGCGADPGESPAVVSSQALLVPVLMHVRPMTLQMVAPKGSTSEAPANPTPNLVLVSWIIKSGPFSIYSTTSKMAIVCVTTAQFNAINADLAAAFADPTHHHVDVNLTYDDSGTATNKPITSFSVTLI